MPINERLIRQTLEEHGGLTYPAFEKITDHALEMTLKEHPLPKAEAQGVKANLLHMARIQSIAAELAFMTELVKSHEPAPTDAPTLKEVAMARTSQDLEKLVNGFISSKENSNLPLNRLRKAADAKYDELNSALVDLHRSVRLPVQNHIAPDALESFRKKLTQNCRDAMTVIDLNRAEAAKKEF